MRTFFEVAPLGRALFFAGSLAIVSGLSRSQWFIVDNFAWDGPGNVAKQSQDGLKTGSDSPKLVSIQFIVDKLAWDCLWDYLWDGLFSGLLVLLGRS
ncbi:hypothetical protein C4580_01590 [Candidatus Woesearchaeota archaeon]|nr:MAG: hypothetical protein C4580_01590 [Candidatus Woesearchaeota archaeon]